jgi:fructan beta-fructosidase
MKNRVIAVVMVLFFNGLPGYAEFTAGDLDDAVKFTGRGDLVVADFEQDDYGLGWTVDGGAFGDGPVKIEEILRECAAVDFVGAGLVDSRLGGDDAQEDLGVGRPFYDHVNGLDKKLGTLTSPEFRVERKYIRFLVAGASFEGKTCVNLLCDGRVVRSSTGPLRDFFVMQPEEWDVADLLGKKVTIQIVDRSDAWRGNILVDQIVQSNNQYVQTHASRVFFGDGKYLLLPVSEKGKYKANITIFAGDKTLRKFSISLAAGFPDWWAFVPVPDCGEVDSFRVEVDKLPADSKGLENISLSDDVRNCTPYDDPSRPQFHYTSRCGYVGDANGLVYFNGVWNLYYQHNSFSRDLTFADLCWGHAISRDLIHWEEQPDALFSPLSRRMFMSGSAVIDKLNTAGFGENSMVALCSSGGESLFYSTDEGRTFDDWPGSPVIQHTGRDPRVFWYDPGKHWVMVVYDKSGTINRNAIYTSPDLKEWGFQSAVNDFFECPDLFELPLDGDPEETKWLMFGCDNQYLVGEFNGNTFTPDAGGSKLKGSHGRCFYAAQTFNNVPEGRRIQMGCMRANYDETSFNHVLSVPLELTLQRTTHGMKLHSYPVCELDQLRENRKDFPGITLVDSEMTLPGVDADVKDIHVEFIIPDDVSRVGVNVGETAVMIDVAANQLICRGVEAPLELVDGKVQLRILVDRGILEIFINNGEIYMPVAVPLSDSPGEISVFSSGRGMVEADFVVYEMRSLWESDLSLLLEDGEK